MEQADNDVPTRPLLEVRDLGIALPGRDGPVKLVDGIDFAIDQGEVLGLVGESGSGKSLTALSILGLLDPPVQRCGGDILFRGENLATIDKRRLRALRGNRIAMVFQDPMSTLNPVLNIGCQIIEAVQAHRPIRRAEARNIAIEALGAAGIPEPDQKIAVYPHQLSGGMRQRVAIAIALLHRPDLLIADEPTTALDVTIQALILARIQDLVTTTRMGLLWITHDLAVVSGLADRLCVLYAGRVVESGPTGSVIARPRHPYTRGLIDARPGRSRRMEPLAQIPGMAPIPGAMPPGCSFAPRCPRILPACIAMPGLAGEDDHRWRCCNPLPETVLP